MSNAISGSPFRRHRGVGDTPQPFRYATHMHHLLQHQNTAEQTISLKAMRKSSTERSRHWTPIKPHMPPVRIPSCTACCNSTGGRPGRSGKPNDRRHRRRNECLTRSAGRSRGCDSPAREESVECRTGVRTDRNQDRRCDRLAHRTSPQDRCGDEDRGDRLVEQARLIVIVVVSLLGLLVVSIYLMMKRLVPHRLSGLQPWQIASPAMTSRPEFEPGPPRRSRHPGEFSDDHACKSPRTRHRPHCADQGTRSLHLLRSTRTSKDLFAKLKVLVAPGKTIRRSWRPPSENTTSTSSESPRYASRT